jgi:hypothetical protein
MKESDTGAFGGEETDVAAADLLGTLALASFIFSDDNKCFKIGYRGNKRYVKAIVTPANNTGAANIAGDLDPGRSDRRADAQSAGLKVSTGAAWGRRVAAPISLR